jgi:hypothetical protein
MSLGWDVTMHLNSMQPILIGPVLGTHLSNGPRFLWGLIVADP